MIREAVVNDLNEIMIMVRAVVKSMHEQGCRQWDENYPAEADYLNDIMRRELFVYEEDGKILGVCAVSKEGHQEYHLINWSSDQPFWTIKRIAISPDSNGRGVAGQFIQFAEELARASGIYYLNADTYSENLRAQKLFQRHGFNYVDKRGGRRGTFEFYYYEKFLFQEEKLVLIEE